MSTLNSMSNEKGPKGPGPERPRITLGTPKPPEVPVDFDQNEDESDAPTYRGKSEVEPEDEPLMELSQEDLTPLPDVQPGVVLKEAATPEMAAERDAVRQAYLEQRRRTAEAAVESRSGLIAPAEQARNVDARGGSNEAILELAKATAKAKIERLLNSEKVTIDDLIEDAQDALEEAQEGLDAAGIEDAKIEAELAFKLAEAQNEKERQKILLGRTSSIGDHERADLSKKVQLAKYELELLEELKKTRE